MLMSKPTFDAVIVGAGAAGLFCAGIAGQLGQRVLLLDHAEKVAEKIRISGGGRCNFTNLDVSATNFLGENPRFAKSALARYTPGDFQLLLKRHQVAFHEKHRGQLFCDRSAEDIINLLLAECGAGSVERWQPCNVKEVRFNPMAGGPQRYEVDTDRGAVHCKSLVIATGGLSIPKIGATDFGYRIARQFGLKVIETRPALVPLTFDETAWLPFASLAGLSLPVEISTGSKKSTARFLEDLLFTHRGLSGPGVLQISSYWRSSEAIHLNLAPQVPIASVLQEAKANSRKRVANELARLVPTRLADTWVGQDQQVGQNWQRPINEVSDKSLAMLATRLANWAITPAGTEGYRKAEVTAGGVDTRLLSGQTMESTQPGLHFIGEVVDVTGWLGGYNFQWAWSSAFACAHGLAAGSTARA
jgi:predicted Rossmann fold flavoprotein